MSADRPVPEGGAGGHPTLFLLLPPPSAERPPAQWLLPRVPSRGPGGRHPRRCPGHRRPRRGGAHFQHSVPSPADRQFCVGVFGCYRLHGIGAPSRLSRSIWYQCRGLHAEQPDDAQPTTYGNGLFWGATYISRQPPCETTHYPPPPRLLGVCPGPAIGPAKLLPHRVRGCPWIDFERFQATYELWVEPSPTPCRGGRATVHARMTSFLVFCVRYSGCRPGSQHQNQPPALVLRAPIATSPRPVATPRDRDGKFGGGGGFFWCPVLSMASSSIAR